MMYYTSNKNYKTICIYRDEEERRKYKKEGYSNITQKEAYEYLLRAYVVRDGITDRMLQRKDIEFILNNSFSRPKYLGFYVHGIGRFMEIYVFLII